MQKNKAINDNQAFERKVKCWLKKFGQIFFAGMLIYGIIKLAPYVWQYGVALNDFLTPIFK
ncbi:MAG: hypothetical protein LBB23_03615 [Rickettsiales bacterium]|jgi:hypothetical protein|nr:hypothetical protein [Rickettsiales bacterium]